MKMKIAKMKRSNDRIGVFWPRRNKAKTKMRMAIIELITFPIGRLPNLFIM